MITIAHRVHTIMDSDRIMVMDRGVVHECDTPAVLLRRPGSIFRTMVERAGIEVPKLGAGVGSDVSADGSAEGGAEGVMVEGSTVKGVVGGEGEGGVGVALVGIRGAEEVAIN